MAMTNIFLILLHVVFANAKQQEIHIQCVIIQEKETIDVPFDIPSFLKNDNKTYCLVHKADLGMLRCGQTYNYTRPECVCSFYNVYDGDYHMYSSCPKGAESDIVTQLKCADCKEYSLNNNGPCINGGKLICRGEEVAPEMTCQCPPNYEGAFCEKKIENITRICNRISMFASFGLEDCDNTEMECVTYSRNKQYAYRCRSDTSQKRLDLPFCLDTESTKPSPADEKETEGSPASGAPTLQFLPILGIVLGGIVFQFCTFL